VVVLVHDANSMNYDDAIFPKFTGHFYQANELEVSSFQLIIIPVAACSLGFLFCLVILWTFINRFWWTHFSNQASSNELEDFVATWYRMHQP